MHFPLNSTLSAATFPERQPLLGSHFSAATSRTKVNVNLNRVPPVKRNQADRRESVRWVALMEMTMFFFLFILFSLPTSST